MNDFDTPWASEIGDFEIYSKSAGEAIAYAESPRIRDRIIECVNNFEEIKRQRDDAISQLSRICREGFGNDDTISQEPADDYVLRKLAEMREAIKEAEKSLKYVHDCLNLWHNAAGYNCQSHDADALADAEITLAKLQPFLKP